MNRSRRLKEWVNVSILVLFIVGVIGITSYISKSVFMALKVDNNSYVLRDIVDVGTNIPVNSEVKKVIEMPFNDTTVTVQINFYDTQSRSEDQEKSLILYDNTYMPNTGILYGSTNTFDVLAVYEGTVESVVEDEVFGSIVTVKHNNNLVTKYSSITNVTVKVGDTVNAGEILGTSGINKVTSVTQNMLLFEMIYNGKYVNPANYYEKSLEEMGL